MTNFDTKPCPFCCEIMTSLCIAESEYNYCHICYKTVDGIDFLLLDCSHSIYTACYRSIRSMDNIFDDFDDFYSNLHTSRNRLIDENTTEQENNHFARIFIFMKIMVHWQHCRVFPNDAGVLTLITRYNNSNLC